MEVFLRDINNETIDSLVSIEYFRLGDIFESKGIKYKVIHDLYCCIAREIE